MSLVLRSRISVAVLTALLSTGVAAQVDGFHTAKQINGPVPAPPKNLPGPSVQGFYAASHWGSGSLLAPTGNVTAYLGRAYATANRTPAAVPSNNPNPCDSDGDPILPATGTKVENYPLFALPGEMGLTYVLYYNGGSWTDNIFYSLDTNCNANPPEIGACKQTTLHRPDGSSLVFAGGPGATSYTSKGVSTLTRDSVTGDYTLQDEDATTQVYSSSGSLRSIKNASGIGWLIETNSDKTSKTVTHTSGKSFSIRYESKSVSPFLEVASVIDPGGNVYMIENPRAPTLSSIAYPGSPATVVTFKYLSFASPPYGSRLSEVQYNGVPYAYTTYDTNAKITGTAFDNARYRWATGTYLGDGSEKVSISYYADNAGKQSATITNPLGHQFTKNYDINGNLTLISNNAVQTCGATVSGRTYDISGHLSAEVDNNGNTHSYMYATNGQLQTETEAYGTAVARTTDYVWDTDRRLNRLFSVTIRGWKKTAYTYNAQNRLASVATTNLSETGNANQTLTTTYSYTLYGNGMVQTMTVTRPSSNGGDKDIYTYDAFGNLASLSNGLGQATIYSNYNGLGEAGRVVGPNGDVTDYTYDARGRIQTRTTYPNGVATTWRYTYDGFGLLYTLTSPDGQVTTWNRNPSTKRVSTITHNDKDGTSTERFEYNLNGDVTKRTVMRGSVVGLVETTSYDNLGRVYQKIGQNGQSLTYAYDGNGNPLSITNAAGHATGYQYDALNRVTQSTEHGGASPAMPAVAPTISVPPNSTSGAYSISWNSISGAATYLLQEQVNGSNWTTLQNGASINWTANNKTSNAYGYRVQACNVTGCGPWSNVGSIKVAIPTAPTSVPALAAPSSNVLGAYTVSWTAVADTSSYILQEQTNGGGWVALQNSASLSWSTSSKGSATYGYRAQACNAVGCGPWSNVSAVVVTLPSIPAVPAAPATPANNATGNYTVSWSPVGGATTYALLGVLNGNWVGLQNSAATSWNAVSQTNGNYGYAVAACNVSGCSAYSPGSSTVVTIPVPIAINGNTYTSARRLTSDSGNQAIGFDITNGNTWALYKTKPGDSHVVIVSGAVPAGAATVKYTWMDAGTPAGVADAMGGVVNPAGSPVAVGSNPRSQYTTGTFNWNTTDRGHQYYLRVDFYNASGISVSSSSALLVTQVLGGQ